jgi:hypothetical protein
MLRAPTDVCQVPATPDAQPPHFVPSQHPIRPCATDSGSLGAPQLRDGRLVVVPYMAAQAQTLNPPMATGSLIAGPARR